MFTLHVRYVCVCLSLARKMCASLLGHKKTIWVISFCKRDTVVALQVFNVRYQLGHASVLNTKYTGKRVMSTHTHTHSHSSIFVYIFLHWWQKLKFSLLIVGLLDFFNQTYQFGEELFHIFTVIALQSTRKVHAAACMVLFWVAQIKKKMPATWRSNKVKLASTEWSMLYMQF